MRVYSSKESCNGCRACEQICPVQCINMVSDGEGFLYPEIDENICIKCNKCKDVCNKIESEKESFEPIVYAARNKNREIRENSSSGGVFYELGMDVLAQNGMVFGAVFDLGFRVIHVGTQDESILKRMCGSKYVQSDTQNTYREVKENLQSGKRVLYSGTPCQIAGLRSFLGSEYDKLICVSIVCHGVPSPLVWNKYLDYKKYLQEGKEPVDINFRDKHSGWRDYAIKLVYEDGVERISHKEDIYMKGFLQNLYLRPSCYHCRVKGTGNSTDIILGDFWGIEKHHMEFDDNLGISAVILNSEKGKNAFSRVEKNFHVVPSKYEYVEKSNPALCTSFLLNDKRKDFFAELKSSHHIEKSISDNLIRRMEKKQQYLFPVILKYLENKVNRKDICDFFIRYGYKSVVLYAVTELTMVLCDDILYNDLGIEILYICDKNYGKFENGYKEKRIVGINEMMKDYEQGKIDCIVIGNILYENDIIKELMQKGCSMDKLISANSIIFSFGD